jgi:hypothetical protein
VAGHSCEPSVATCFLFSFFSAPFGTFRQKATSPSISPRPFIFYCSAHMRTSSCNALLNVLSWLGIAASLRWPPASCFLTFCPHFGHFGPNSHLAFHISPTFNLILFSSYENLIVLCFTQCVAVAGHCCEPSVATCFFLSCFLAPFGHFGPNSHVAFHISPTFYLLLFSSYENLIV